jgi:hypothetical protein
MSQSATGELKSFLTRFGQWLQNNTPKFVEKYRVTINSERAGLEDNLIRITIYLDVKNKTVMSWEADGAVERLDQ